MVSKYTGFSSNNYTFPIYYIMIRGKSIYIDSLKCIDLFFVKKHYFL